MNHWLITDRRLGDHGVGIARRLSPGSTIYVRSPDLTDSERRSLTLRLRRIAVVRRLALLLPGPPGKARRMGADSVHLRGHERHRAYSGSNGSAARAARKIGLTIAMPVHNRAEAIKASMARADYWLISPLYPTRSHPSAPGLGAGELGVLGFVKLAGIAKRGGFCPVALGGMDSQRAVSLQKKLVGYNFTARKKGQILLNWAAIDAWSTM